MTASKDLPAASSPPSGPSTPDLPTKLPTKAERLEYLTDPFGPEFPLDEDLQANLAVYPGPMPRSVRHYMRLLLARQP